MAVIMDFKIQNSDENDECYNLDKLKVSTSTRAWQPKIGLCYNPFITTPLCPPISILSLFISSHP